MNEQVKQAGVEDVLSSIRRLVADGPGLAQRGGAPAVRAAVPLPLAEAAAALPPALVLSPAQRIAAASDAAAAPAEAPPSARLTELEAALEAEDQRYEAALTPAVEPPLADPACEEAPFVEVPEPAGGEIFPWTGAASGMAQLPTGEAAPELLAAEDHALLRAMIRDVLREELQGDTGDRVTRNLRRLVRSEVARALALQIAASPKR